MFCYVAVNETAWILPEYCNGKCVTAEYGNYYYDLF